MIMLEGQPRVPQESDGQRWSATDAAEAGSKRPAQREDVDGAEVGKFAGLEVAPDLLDGMQFRRIARQSFDRQPRPLVSEILSHHAALVAAEAIPDQDDLTAGEVALEGAQKADQRNCRAASGSNSGAVGHPSGRPMLRRSTSATRCGPCASRPAGGRAGPTCGGRPVDARRRSRLRRRSTPAGVARFFYLRPALAPPAGDRRLVPLARLARPALERPAQPSKDVPNGSRVVLQLRE